MLEIQRYMFVFWTVCHFVLYGQLSAAARPWSSKSGSKSRPSAKDLLDSYYADENKNEDPLLQDEWQGNDDDMYASSTGEDPTRRNPGDYTDNYDERYPSEYERSRHPPPGTKKPPPPPPRRPPPPPSSQWNDSAMESRSPPSLDDPLGSRQHNQPRTSTTEMNPQHSQYEPIHYNFPAEHKTKKRGFFGRRRTKEGKKVDTSDQDDIPETFSPPIPPPSPPDLEEGSRPYEQRRDGTSSPEERMPQYASPRRDIITRYRSTAGGRVKLALSSGLAGSIAGAFLGKSIMNRPGPLATAFFVLFLFCNFLRNAYAELTRALGMALILAFQRTYKIRRRYPTWRHVKASIGAFPRRPFPPTKNPWAYRPERENDVEFRMLYSLIAMAFVGSMCGGSIPLIPTWMGSLAGAGFFALSTTMQSSRGDLTRTMGMRVVALCEEMIGINSELEILRKGGVVTGKILDKLFILDRKHRIKDRLIAGASFAYRLVSHQVNRVQTEMQQQDDTTDGRPPPRRRPDPGRRPTGPRDDTGERPPRYYSDRPP